MAWWLDDLPNFALWACLVLFAVWLLFGGRLTNPRWAPARLPLWLLSLLCGVALIAEAALIWRGP